jgi:hypothetical protein
MDDFRVGSVPSSEPYGHRQPYASVARKRQRHHDDEDGRQQDDGPQEDDAAEADTFEAAPAGDGPASAAAEPIEDYYLPSDPTGGEE